MKTQIALPDLVMLQMMGGLDDYIEEIERGLDGEEIVRELEDNASEPGLFQEIVEKTVESQFGDRYAFVRELGQNAKDAYDIDYPNRQIEFETRTSEGNIAISVRDRGIGMEPSEVVKDLLIPYNSGKKLDLDKIGEHGIGWYSILDFADKVEVVTGRNGSTTRAIIEEAEDTFQSLLETSEEEFDGTEITLHREVSWLGGKEEVEKDIYDKLVHHVGLTDPETTDILFNGEKINTLSEDYQYGGETEIVFNGNTGTLDLYYARNHESGIKLTQDGLFIKKLIGIEDTPFRPNSLHYRMMEKLQSRGYGFWVDLPTNIGLTKGRNEIVAADKDKAFGAIPDAFENMILEEVLEDSELIQQLDLKVTDLIEGNFKDAYRKEKRIIPGIGAILHGIKSKLADIGHSGSYGKDSPGNIVSTGGGLSWEGVKNWLLGGSDDEPATNRQLNSYYHKMSDFSQRIFEKEFIPAATYFNGEIEETKTSIHDMIAAHLQDQLYPQTDYLEYFRNQEQPKEGLYVDTAHTVASDIYHKLRQIDRQDALRTSNLMGLRPDIGWKELFDNLLTQGKRYWQKLTDIGDTEDDDREVTFLHRTDLNTLEKVVENEEIGYEYHDFIRTGEYLEQLISEANDMTSLPVLMHASKTGINPGIHGTVDIAHHERAFHRFLPFTSEKISFNLQTHSVDSIVDDIREGEMSLDSFMTYADILLHEKTHQAQDTYESTASHGTVFYTEKRRIRDNFLQYCQEEGVDPLDDINNMIHSDYDSTELEELAPHIDTYSRFYHRLKFW